MVAAADAGACHLQAADCNADGLLTCFQGTFVTDAGAACPLPPFVPLSCVE